MRISTRMLLGSTMIKWMRGTRNNGDGYGCALGMIEAAGGHGACHALTYLFVELPCACDLRNKIMGSACRYEFYEKRCRADSAVVHLFNDHVMTRKDWSMERLIDWVRSVEPSDPEEDQKQEETVTEEELVCP